MDGIGEGVGCTLLRHPGVGVVQRERDRGRQGQTDSDRDRDREGERGRETHRERERETKRPTWETISKRRSRSSGKRLISGDSHWYDMRCISSNARSTHCKPGGAAGG